MVITIGVGKHISQLLKGITSLVMVQGETKMDITEF